MKFQKDLGLIYLLYFYFTIHVESLRLFLPTILQCALSLHSTLVYRTRFNINSSNSIPITTKIEKLIPLS